MVSHSGGHLPFQANITDLVKMGAPNRITVAINNTLTPHTLPPGTLTHGGPPELPEGFVSLNYQFDFYNYAGECMGVYQSLCWTLNQPLVHFLNYPQHHHCILLFFTLLFGRIPDTHLVNSFAVIQYTIGKAFNEPVVQHIFSMCLCRVERNEPHFMCLLSAF